METLRQAPLPLPRIRQARIHWGWGQNTFDHLIIFPRWLKGRWGGEDRLERTQCDSQPMAGSKWGLISQDEIGGMLPSLPWQLAPWHHHSPNGRPPEKLCHLSTKLHHVCQTPINLGYSTCLLYTNPSPRHKKRER